MKRRYHTINKQGKVNEANLAEFLSKNGQLLLPMVDLIEQCQWVCDDGVEISRKTMCGWLAQCADLLQPLYRTLKEMLFESKAIGTDDTSVKVLDNKLPFARTGRIWPYCGDEKHPVIAYDYTATRERAGPEKFLAGYRGYLQADAYSGYEALFKDKQRRLIEVACWAHARRYFHRTLESDRGRMG